MPELEPRRPADLAPATDAWRPSSEAPLPGPTAHGPGSGSGATDSRQSNRPVPEPSGSGSATGRSVPNLLPGDQLDAYFIEQPLGIGGMGSVFLARDQRLERLVALKVLPPEQQATPENVQRFIQEGRAAAKLDHENIARIYCLGQDRGIPFIAFEYVAGETIRQRVERAGCLAPLDVIELGQQITAAILHSSSRGVIHRDIKPSNILVTPTGALKLVDMGLARQFERTGPDPGLTESGMTLGTFDYISPEQARDPRSVDVRSDLYSLGCTFFHMLTGRPPFPDGTVLQKLLLHQEEPAPDVRSVRPDVPAPLAAIVHKLLQKDPTRRYQTPEELRKALQAAAEELSPSGRSTDASVGSKPLGWEFHLLWGVPALGLALVVAALSWWSQLSDNQSGVVEPPVAGSVRQPSSTPTGPGQVASHPESDSGSERVAPGHALDDPARTPEVPRTLAVGSDMDLATAIGSAPSGSTIVLTDNGPYLLPTLPTESTDSLATGSSPPRSLRIQADERVRPVVRARTPTSANRQDTALLAFRGGRVEIHGIEFQLERESPSTALAAIAIDGTELTVANCQFRNRSAGRAGNGMRAIEVRSQSRAGADAATATIPATRIVGTFFDAEINPIFGRAPLDISLRDCQMGPGQPLAWLDNPTDRAVAPAYLTLRQCSVLTGESPVFRLNRVAARIEVENSVIGPALNEPTVLVATDEPARLEWLGRDNLYGLTAQFLTPLGTSATTFEPVLSFSTWRDGPDSIREIRSTQIDQRLWLNADPLSLLAQRDPTPAFALALSSSKNLGARPNAGKLGSPLASLIDVNGSASRTAGGTGSTTNPNGTDPESGNGGPESSKPVGTEHGNTNPTRPNTPPAMEVRPDDSPRNPIRMNDPGTATPMPVSPMPDTSTFNDIIPPFDDLLDPARSPARATTDPDLASTPSADTKRPTAADGASALWRDVSNGDDLSSYIESNRQLSGGKVRVGARDPLVAAPITLSAGSRWLLQSETPTRRSRIELKADRPLERSPEAVPPALFNLRSGSTLELVDLDIVLPRTQRPSHGQWSAFGLESGASLVLRRCTVTLEGAEANSLTTLAPRSSVVRIGPRIGSDEGTTAIRIEDSLIRADGEVVDESTGRRLEVTLINSVVASAGSLVRVRGVPARGTNPSATLTLRQVTACSMGGLVFLDTPPARTPGLRVNVIASDTILTTGSGLTPLLRSTGIADPGTANDRIVWNGQHVVYHDISIYRRDETSRDGDSTVGETRGSWEASMGNLDLAAFHGDAMFQHDLPGTIRPWQITLDDVRLSNNSPVPLVGPRLDQLPEPPAR